MVVVYRNDDKMKMTQEVKDNLIVVSILTIWACAIGALQVLGMLIDQ